ncbi:DNA polymerase III subunit beta [Candidatus Wolfebacteria bacterium]|nr:DNA polymerase III subunit beta [Candidatus Wolfebacteria bacterium]
MKLIILRKNLKDGLKRIEKIASENSNLPILKNFLIESCNNKIKLSATNLEIAIITLIPGKIVEEGAITIPLTIFNSIIGNIQNERISLETENDKLIIKTDNYSAEINGIKKEEFPIIPNIENTKFYFEISNILLLENLTSIISSANNKNSKQELNGVLFDFQTNLVKLATTDTFRLSEKTINKSQFESNINKDFKIIIPILTIFEVIKELQINENGKALIYFDPNQILFKIEDTQIISRLINGEFPDYQQIIPKKIEIEAVLETEQLINAVKLSSVFSDRFNEIKFLIKEDYQNIEIFSVNQTIGENKYIISIKNKIKLENQLEMAFNWQFLLDGIKNIKSENISLGLNTENKPIIIKSPEDHSWFYILMPLKV